MPLAMCWPAAWPAGQQDHHLVSLIDVTRTIFDVAEVSPQQADQLTGKSLSAALRQCNDKTVERRVSVFSGRERHSSSRFHSLGYPSRCIRTDTYLYIRNFAPDRWPAGTPQKYASAKFNLNNQLVSGTLGPKDGGYHDIDDGPTLQWMIANQGTVSVKQLLDAAVAIRPAEELYNIQTDPACLHNLASQIDHQDARSSLSKTLDEYLRQTGDLRVTDPRAAHQWEMYPRYSSLRWFPEPDWWSNEEKRVPEQPWLEEKRPRSE